MVLTYVNSASEKLSTNLVAGEQCDCLFVQMPGQKNKNLDGKTEEQSHADV